MFNLLPQTSEDFRQLSWSAIEPWYIELSGCVLTQENLNTWLSQWSQLSALVDEVKQLFEIATAQNTADEEQLQRKQRFIAEIYTNIQPYDLQIKQNLLASGLIPENFELPIRDMRVEILLYSKDNLEIQVEDETLSDEYMKIQGSLTGYWDDSEIPLSSLAIFLTDFDRSKREKAWHCITKQRSLVQEKLNAIWSKKMTLHQRIAHNAGFANYRDYRWQQLRRFDYSSIDSQAFHSAVEQVVVPIASKIWQQRQQRLGVDKLRPWDMALDGRHDNHAQPITDIDSILHKRTAIFHLIDPHFGNYFETMLQDHLIDLEKRPNKAPGGFVYALEVQHRPFIFGRINTTMGVVRTIFHEAGHAFHVFEMAKLPYLQQHRLGALPLEFAEVPSICMEFIGSLFLSKAGICTERDATLLRINHLEDWLISYLPELIIGDAFQHWIYAHPDEAIDPKQCNMKWIELTHRYQPSTDWSGLEAELSYDWQQIPHFFCYPFYVIEYAFAAIGALQILKNYLSEPEITLQQLR